MIQRALEFTPIVEQVREIDPRFAVVAIELQRLAEGRDASVVVAETMLGVSDTSHGFRRVTSLFCGSLEEMQRFAE
jgi:hypothetical protein